MKVVTLPTHIEYIVYGGGTGYLVFGRPVTRHPGGPPQWPVDVWPSAEVTRQTRFRACETGGPMPQTEPIAPPAKPRKHEEPPPKRGAPPTEPRRELDPRTRLDSMIDFR